MAIDRVALSRIAKGNPDSTISCKRKFLAEVERTLMEKDAEIEVLRRMLKDKNEKHDNDVDEDIILTKTMKQVGNTIKNLDRFFR